MTKQLLRILLFALLFLSLTAFFWGSDENKVLRQLHTTAESSFKKGDYQKAKESYVDMLSRVSIGGLAKSKVAVDWATYVDIHLRLAQAYEKLEECQEGAELLKQLLRCSPPTQYLAQIELLHARLSLTDRPASEAYIKLQRLAAHYPTDQWDKAQLSFYHALKHALNAKYDAMIQRAKRLLTARLYHKAIDEYNRVLIAIQQKEYPKTELRGSLIEKHVRYRLAEAHYKQADYAKSLSYLQTTSDSDESIDREMLYLAALCHKEKKEYQKALELFQEYTGSDEKRDSHHYEHALFEIGHFYYTKNNWQEARRYFLRATQTQQQQNKAKLVAAIYLARLDLQEKAYSAVEKRLAPITASLAASDALRYECYYLRGEAAFALQNYKTARAHFEQALPTVDKAGKWANRALLRLGGCYIALQEKTKGERIFQALLRTEEKQCATLALLRLYLGEQEERFLKLYTSSFNELSAEGQLEALLLRAEGESAYRKREEIYKQACESSYHSLPLAAEVWHLRGLNHFEEGLKDEVNNNHYFELATTCFEQAFRRYEKEDHRRAARALKFEAKASFYRNTLHASLTLLDRLLTQFDESLEEHEQTLYLKGLAASRIDDSTHFALAKETLRTLVDHYPEGEYADKALHVLATLLFNHKAFSEAKATYIELAKSYPASPFVADAWFWAAESADHLDENSLPLREVIYARYPTYTRAAQAYFRAFPYSAYVEGESAALTHLKAFPSRFPKSPLLVVVHALIGMHEKAFGDAEKAFEQALLTFSYCTDVTPIESAYVYFRYQASLDLALLHLNQGGDLDCARALLEGMAADFDDPSHPYTPLLLKETLYPALFEECEYALVQCYLKQEKTHLAQRRLELIIDHYEEAGVERGYYLALAWREQGRLALTCGDLSTAGYCFETALNTGEGYLLDDQLLSLWIDQSDCYHKMGQLDTAMLFLSKVINADVASAVRLEAMYRRTEIYEQQGRPELAIRQLEAMTKKGGAWALQAQEKLRVDYGIE